MKPLVIYHDNCADGFGAAFAAWLKLGDDAEYLPMQYGKTPDEYRAAFSPHDREIYILDFSFPRTVMGDLFDYAMCVVWLDHHRTAFEMYGWKEQGCVTGPCIGVAQKHHVMLSNEASGALLAWEYFHPDTEVPMLIRHIDDRDRWQFKLTGTREFHAALLSGQPWSFKQWHKLFGSELESMYRAGRAILQAHNQNVQAMMKQARKCEITEPETVANFQRAVWSASGYYMLPGLACNAPPFLASDLGHALATQSGTYGLVWHLDADNLVRCSLRSNDDYDVSAIAKAFGGGGHKNAAGFSINLDILARWLA